MHSQQRRVLLLADGNALVHRAFHALPPLTTSRTGEMVNAVYGFANTLFKVVNTVQASHWAIAFDYPAPTFRHAMFEQYKAQRPPTPDELKSQIQRVHEFAQALGIPSFEMEGYEADDILGTLAIQAREAGIQAAILTGDRDLLQMVRTGISVLLPGRNFSDAVTYDEAAVVARFGVTPSQLTAYKALMGDASDNIPGVPGVGEKTAAKLLSQFGSFESLFEHVAQVTPRRVQGALAASVEQAKASRELATILTNVPVHLRIEDCSIGSYDHDRAVALLKELEFNSLVGRLPAAVPVRERAQEVPSPVASRPRTAAGKIYSEQDAASVGRELEQAREVVLCAVVQATEAASPRRQGRTSPRAVSLRGLGVSVEAGQLTFVPSGASPLYPGVATGGLAALTLALRRDDCLKVSDDAKTLLRSLLALGVPATGPWFDISVAAHLVGEKAISLTALALSRLGTMLEDVHGASDRLAPPSDERVAAMLAPRAAACWALRADLESSMREREVLALFREVEMPLIPVLADMEDNGILVDTQKLHAMSRTLGEQLASLEIDIYNAVGHRFNINSPKQLGTVLFDELHVQNDRRLSRRSTDATQLETLREGNPVIDLVLRYRQLSKLKSTYVDTLPGLVNPRTGRIHTVFSQTTAATGRLSSSDPNLQNLPIRTELGRTIRAAVVAPHGWSLLSADYSQIDLRSLAHLSQDEALKAAFLNDEDIHTATASRVFGVPPEGVTPDMRRAAKVVNFGVIYGMSDYGLEQATEFSRAEAGRFIKAYFQQYPGVQKWLDQTKVQAQEKLYVTTLLGRRRYVPEIRSSSRQVREAAERMAINAPVQGTSADIIKVAMIRIHDAMRTAELRSRMLLQIHDELLFEAPEDELPRLAQVVRELMPNAVTLTVPLKVDLKSGPNWADVKPLAA